MTSPTGDGALRGSGRLGDRLGDAHRPLRVQVEDEVRQRIVDGRLEPGRRLVEHLLADELGVSRNPVRESLRVLESEGFVRTLPRRGVVVVALDEQAVKDLFDVRGALETRAAELAAGRVAAGTADPAALSGMLDRSRAATERDDYDAVTQLNSAFHGEIVRLAGNTLLEGMMRPLMWRVQWAFHLSAERRAPHSWTEHRGLLDAIVAGDVEAAGSSAAAHVEWARAAAADAVAGA